MVGAWIHHAQVKPLKMHSILEKECYMGPEKYN